jgi:hypothetical protein
VVPALTVSRVLRESFHAVAALPSSPANKQAPRRVVETKSDKLDSWCVYRSQRPFARYNTRLLSPFTAGKLLDLS